jgi:hypothetical protein
MPRLRVSQAIPVTGRGVAVFFDHSPLGLVFGSSVGVLISRPGESADIQAIAVVEAARVAAPPGEVVAFSLPALSKEDVPVGSYISFEEPT